MSETANPNIGHGHVWKRADGMLARCGGPIICSECRADAMRLKEAAIYKTELDISLLIRAKDEWQSRAQKAEKLTAEIASLRAQLDEAKAALSDIAGASWGQASNGQPMTHKRLTIDRAEKALRALLSESKT